MAYEYLVASHGVVAILCHRMVSLQFSVILKFLWWHFERTWTPFQSRKQDHANIRASDPGKCMSKRPGKMHASGHDLHVTMPHQRGKAPSSPSPSLRGHSEAFVQPAEEGGAGTEVMINEGALGDASTMFGVHVGPA